MRSPAPAAQHFVPVAFDRPMDLLQGTKVSGNAVVGVMASQRGVESIELLPDGPMPVSSQQVLQRHETAPQARFLGAHSNPEVALQVPRTVEREPRKVDRFRALPTVFGGMLLREPAKFRPAWSWLVLGPGQTFPAFCTRRPGREGHPLD